MNASMVRLGGILAFVLIAVAIISAFLAQNKVVAIIFSLIIYAMIVFVFWSTKGLFNNLNYSGGDIPILGIIAMIVLSFLLSLIGGSGMGALMNPGTMGAGGANIIGIIGLIIMLLWFALWIWFGLKCMGFASAGGGLWKAIGILYLVASGLILLMLVLMILGLVAGSQGLLATGGIFGFIGMLVMLAAWICHGIGLIMGAGKMQQA